jgi:hypothetical protein
VKGNYVSHDALTEKFLVTSGAETKTATGVPQARVRAIIQPKGKNAENPAEKKGEPLTLKPADNIAPRE